MQADLSLSALYKTPTTPPTFPAMVHSQPRSTALLSANLQTKAFPTGAWWINLAFPGSLRAVPLPYDVMKNSTTNGLDISYDKLTTSNTSVMATFLRNFSIKSNSLTGVVPVIDRYDLLTADLLWSKPNGTSLEFILARGSPFITGKSVGVPVQFGSQHAITSLVTSTGAFVSGEGTGTKFIFILNNGQIWHLWFGSSVTIVRTSAGIYTKTPYTGTFRIAEVSHGINMDDYADWVPVSANISYAVEGNSAALTYKWKTERLRGVGNGSLLLCALPHHIESLAVSSVVTGLIYKTIKGIIKGVTGDTWVLQEALTKIQWDAPRPIDSDKINDVKAALQSQTIPPNVQDDSYFDPKYLAKISRLILIAKAVGNTPVITTMMEILKPYLIQWLDSVNINPLRYETGWGGICSKDGLIDKTDDFGNGQYNDHHYHYGYIIYAIAVCGRFDAAFLATYKDKIIQIVRDIACSDPTDSYFPIARHKDWYDGHSWANGLDFFGDSKNQESTSEAINGYYAIYLLGLALRDQNLANWGRILLASEIRSSIKYWHIMDTSIYAEPFASNKVVGVLWASKVDFLTWFGPEVEKISGIQKIPTTPIMEEVLLKVWLKDAVPVFLARVSATMSQAWKGFLIASGAIIDKPTYWEQAKQLTQFDDGNTKANLLYFISTRTNDGSTIIDSPSDGKDYSIWVEPGLPPVLDKDIEFYATISFPKEIYDLLQEKGITISTIKLDIKQSTE